MNDRIRAAYRLRRIVAILLLAGVATAGCAGPESADARDWTSLFNGTDLTGWTVKCRPADRNKEFWKVDEGTILADSMGHEGHDYVWLVTNREYADFVLRLQFQAYRDSPGNSGIQVRSRYDDQAGWLDGPQIDIHPPGPWRTGMIWDETRGVGRWLYPDRPRGQWVNQTMANPEMVFYYADEGPGWNTLEITTVGTRITALLNGVLVTDYEGAGVLDDSVHQTYDVGLRGSVALQIHKADELRIRFKDVEVRPWPVP